MIKVKNRRNYGANPPFPEIFDIRWVFLAFAFSAKFHPKK